MQTAVQFERKNIGSLLFKLSQATTEEKKEDVRQFIKEIIENFPEEKNILNFFMEAAERGNAETILERGVLIPDFSAIGINSTVSNGHIIASWNK